MRKNFSKKLETVEDVSQIFLLVKEIVKTFTGRERAGLMVGFADLGGNPGSFVGAFYPVGSNLIVLNKTPMRVVEATKPELYKEYCFHLILHEYLHAIGILDERKTRVATAMVCELAFGQQHVVTTIAKNFNAVFPEVMYSTFMWQPMPIKEIDIVNVDEPSANYIG